MYTDKSSVVPRWFAIVFGVAIISSIGLCVVYLMSLVLW